MYDAAAHHKHLFTAEAAPDEVAVIARAKDLEPDPKSCCSRMRSMIQAADPFGMCAMTWAVEHRATYKREGLAFPSNLTDAEWAVLAPLIPQRSRTAEPALRTLHSGRCPIALSTMADAVGAGCVVLDPILRWLESLH